MILLSIRIGEQDGRLDFLLQFPFHLIAIPHGLHNWLDGGKNYQLHIPANVPAKEFWSVIVYDNSTRSILDNGVAKTSVSSADKNQVNADGSIDVFFGPFAPAGKEVNWIKTLPGKGWFTYFRWYGPTEAFFDKSWKLGDIEKLK